MRRRHLALFLLIPTLWLGSACASSEPEPTSLVIFVDKEVEQPLARLIELFGEAHPDVEVEVVVGASSDLAARLRGGEAADIVIGDRSAVDQLKAEEIARGDVLLFATDVLQIAVPDGNPANITGLADFGLDRPARTAIADKGTTSGGAARRLFNGAQIDAAPDFDDLNPIELIFMLANRELDAGILWRSQASHAPTPLSSVAIPLEHEQRSYFSIAGVNEAAATIEAAQWLASDPTSQELLAAMGLRDTGGTPTS